MDQTRQWDSVGEFGIDAQLEQDAIRIKVAGNHFLNCGITFHGEANVTYFAELRRNGLRIAEGFMAAQEVTIADKPFHMAVFGAYTLREGDLISVYIGSDEAGGADFRMIYGQFGVMSL